MVLLSLLFSACSRGCEDGPGLANNQQIQKQESQKQNQVVVNVGSQEKQLNDLIQGQQTKS